MPFKQFSDNAVRKIVATVRTVERAVQGGALQPPRGAEGPQRPWYYGKLKAILSPGGSAEIDVYKWDSSAWVDDGWDLTVYAPPVFTTGTIPRTKWVQAMLHIQAGRYYVVAREC